MTTFKTFVAVVTVVLSGHCQGASGAQAAAAPRGQFQFLRVGEVRPRGWLLDQIRMDVTNGYAPWLDRLTDRIEPAIFDSRNRTELVKPKIGGDWWNGETTGNWLDGFIRAAYLSGDAAAKRRVDELVMQMLAMQDADGYLGIYPKARRFESPVVTQNAEFWTQACLFRGLLAYHELTGRQDVFVAVERATKLMISKYGPDRPYWAKRIIRGGPGHNIMFVDVCEWMHRLTGDRGYVEFARFIYDGYCEPADVRENDVQLRNLSDLSRGFHGHGAHVMEHMRVPLFLAAATGEAKYRAAADNFFPKSARHLVAGGACISDEDVLGRPGSPHLGCEYCTSLEFLHSLQSGVEKFGRGELADAIEVMAFNSAEGARQHDGRAIQYCTVDNQFEATAKGIGGRMKLSPTHEDVAVCCPVTALKFFPYFVNELWMKTAAGDGLVAVNYAPNELQTEIKGVNVRIRCETAYPFEDEVRMTVTPENPLTCGIRLRIPGWAGGTSVASPGAAVADHGGWRVLTKEWRAGDRIVISFRPEIERRAMAGGEVYWKRGPLVYALPIAAEIRQIKAYPVAGFADYDYTPGAGAFWDYAVDEKSGKFQFLKTAASGNPWTNPPVRLAGNLVNRKTGGSEPVTLLPMGANLLRRVAFPELKDAASLERQARLLQGSLNLARSAKVTASSTAKGYVAEAVVDGVAQGFPENETAEWASDHATTGAKVRLTWDSPVTVENVWLFDRPNPADQVQGAWINFSDGTSAMAGELPNDGTKPFQLNFPEKSVTWMEVIITKVGPKTKSAGFSEIAVFSKEPAQ
ncbi:MAG: beta-L-arabinofuranosidase domain-containing protein [Limisphaerales bacterium]